MGKQGLRRHHGPDPDGQLTFHPTKMSEIHTTRRISRLLRIVREAATICVADFLSDTLERKMITLACADVTQRRMV